MAPLVLCGSTLRSCAGHEALRAAAAAGFDAVSLWPVMVERSLAAGWSPARLRGLVDELGVAVDCLEPVHDWTAGRPPQDGITAERVLEIAAALGARMVLASAAHGGRPDELATFAAAAADHGLLVGVEFLGWGAVTSLPAAWRLVDEADHPGIGLVYDTWHQRRGSGSDDDLALVPAARVINVQLADGPARPAPDETDPVLEARWRRRLPGEGAMDVAGQLRRLAAHGVVAPIGVEVWAEGNERDPDAAATSALAALRAVVAAAGM